MRHLLRRSTELVALALLALQPWEGGTAQAQSANAALRGQYNLTNARTCQLLNDSGAPLGVQLQIVIRGSISYDGSGNGSFDGQGLAINASGETPTNQTCRGTYTVNLDGSFTQRLDCNLTFIATGATATLNGIEQQGQLSLDGTVLLLSDTATNVEIFTPTSPPGPIQQRRCNSSGIATSKR